MKTQIFFTGGEWDGRKESLEIKAGETISTLDVPIKGGMYARYVCHGHDKAPRSVEVHYDRPMTPSDLTRTQKQPALDIMATETKASEWKLLSQEKPPVGETVMIGHLDPAQKPYNVTLACMDAQGHWRFTPNAERTIGWVPTAFKKRFGV
jgi:hypothetical protein